MVVVEDGDGKNYLWSAWVPADPLSRITEPPSPSERRAAMQRQRKRRKLEDTVVLAAVHACLARIGPSVTEVRVELDHQDQAVVLHMWVVVASQREALDLDDAVDELAMILSDWRLGHLTVRGELHAAGEQFPLGSRRAAARYIYMRPLKDRDPRSLAASAD